VQMAQDSQGDGLLTTFTATAFAAPPKAETTDDAKKPGASS